ncbi:MAG TPA: hypothetical protein VEX86_09865 [Longimicrobium sp.]|nr:hypothetical protein [Longimicrobium sp.]
MRHLSTSRCAFVALLLAAAPAVSPSPARGQLRGLPVFFDPTYSYDTRAGVDVGHGGEAGGTAIAVTASRLYQTGNCKRVAVSGGVGTLNPRGGDFETHLMAGALASVLVNPCPRPTSISNPTFRVFAGAGAVHGENGTVADLPIGVGAGYMVPLAIGRIEVWATPRAHYRGSLPPLGHRGWDFAVSGGLNIGVASLGGVRAALDCCEGGVGVGYGFSLWF